MDAINGALKEICREAFECRKSSPSASQQQAIETLRHMGLSVEDEVRCPKSGYSITIDMIVHDSSRGVGGEMSTITGTWAAEFDGPSHFLTSSSPTGALLPKQGIWSCWATTSSESPCPTGSGMGARGQARGSSI
jgi:hypothetical protein